MEEGGCDGKQLNLQVNENVTYQTKPWTQQEVEREQKKFSLN